MKRGVAGLMLLAVLGLVAVSGTDVQAQKKGGKAPAGGSITISAGKDGKFRFQIRSGEDKYICGSGAYATAKDAEAGLEELKKVLATAKPTVEKGAEKEMDDEEKKKKDKGK